MKRWWPIGHELKDLRRRFNFVSWLLDEKERVDSNRGRGLRTHVKARLDRLGRFVDRRPELAGEALVTAIMAEGTYVDRQAVRRDLERLRKLRASSSRS